MSHFVADVANPMHTDQSNKEEDIHGPYEDDVDDGPPGRRTGAGGQDAHPRARPWPAPLGRAPTLEGGRRGRGRVRGLHRLRRDRVDSGDYSFAYVARWAEGSTDLLKETGERVMACAREILQQLEASDHAMAS
jgi:hypothetical protein